MKESIFSGGGGGGTLHQCTGVCLYVGRRRALRHDTSISSAAADELLTVEVERGTGRMWASARLGRHNSRLGYLGQQTAAADCRSSRLPPARSQRKRLGVESGAGEVGRHRLCCRLVLEDVERHLSLSGTGASPSLDSAVELQEGFTTSWLRVSVRILVLRSG